MDNSGRRRAAGTGTSDPAATVRAMRSQDPKPGRADVVCVALGMSIERVRLYGRWLSGAVDAGGCDGTLRMSERWATTYRADPPRFVDGLLTLGARCDCLALDLVAGR